MSDSLLPHNATPQERALEAVISPAMAPPVPLREVWDPNTCPVELLPWLAFAFFVDDWDPAWSETTKREVIRQSVGVHRRKGTVGSVRRALEVVFEEPQVQEWFETGDAPHTFSVSVSGVIKDGTSIALARDIVSRTKPARSHLTKVQVLSPAEHALRIGTAVSVRMTQVIDAEFPSTMLAQFCGTAVSQFIRQEIPSHG